MPQYYFQLRTTNAAPPVPVQEPRDLPDLQAAMIEAQRAVRTMVRTRAGHAPLTLRGSLDIEDERRQPVARIMLADVARQIS